MPKDHPPSPVINPNVEERVSLAVAIRSYLAARERLHTANSAFVDACETLRSQAARGQRVIAHIDYRYWLLEVDPEGNFDLAEVDLV